MTARIGVVTFPGSLDDRDVRRAVGLAGASAVALWHASDTLAGADAVILPGGFSYGERLRGGPTTRLAPVMGEVVRHARRGLPVLGIGNGFRTLCEAQLLPGSLLRDDRGTFACREQRLLVASIDTVWTVDYWPYEQVTLVVKHGEGPYVADHETLTRLEDQNRIVLRYADETPNGSVSDIAGVTNERGNVVGLMAHPEHSIGELTGPSSDGSRVFSSVQRFLRARQPA
ncbi:phosphoribosylformylglycinamidine synthase subunit PurQ [Propionicicella superfundia]|uniref:phosphoribosylformylglycinamidine synthase subunit PurQ n=1 Tax=Propionicicella superfundia TaxID=348582 RepID=UPI0003FB2163|nr:phosphoribosylformylglycinamidine synthase subunit PurQ [Propionicicella superfundia]